MDSPRNKPFLIDAGGQNSCSPDEIRQITSVKQIQLAIEDAKKSNSKITLFGMRHSQAGQICHDKAIALDMNSYNKIIRFDEEKSQITVESGILWSDIQKAIQPFELAVQVMQFVNTFTVAGSMSANIFSRDPRCSRLIETIISFTLVTESGEVLICSRNENYELFTLVIEGHGLFGVIGEVVIQLVPDSLLFVYASYTTPQQDIENILYDVKNSHTMEYHNAQYVLEKNEFMQQVISHSYFSENQKIGPPENVISRNEMMAGTRELELTFWDAKGSDALLGFFIPVASFLKFHEMLQRIIEETELKVFKCSMNYLPAHQESFLSTDRGPCIKFAIFYRHESRRKAEADKLKQACAKAVLECSGTIYLTFDFLVTAQQMDGFYPKWREFLAQKLHYDPQELFYNRFYERLCELVS